MKANLYNIVCNAIEVLIEDFSCGDIDLPTFSTKVERIMGNDAMSDISPEHGFEWTVSDNGMGVDFDLYYASATHRATMQIRTYGGNRHVHATIDHDDYGDYDAVIADAEVMADAESDEDTGCGDPECPNCGTSKDASSVIEQIKASLENAVVVDGSIIPAGVLLSFGPIKRDLN